MNESHNDIPEKQNTERSLEYLGASSCIYSTVKNYSVLQTILSIPFPIGLSVVAILWPEYKVWASIYGITVSIVDVLYIDKRQKDLKKEAAKIQERFDCELFGLEWNDFKVGDKPAREKTNKASEAFLKKDSNVRRIKDWYSPHVGKIPLYLARVVCQRTNIYWDSELRRGYVDWITGLALSLLGIALVTGMALKMGMETFVLTLLVPISPTLLWSAREITRQKESAATLDRLMKYAQQLWKDAIGKKISEVQVTEKSRALQDELFVHRYSNQPIFNWIHNLVRKKYEAQMNIGAEELVNESLKTESR